jgi:hypothetical protein
MRLKDKAPVFMAESLSMSLPPPPQAETRKM